MDLQFSAAWNVILTGFDLKSQTFVEELEIENERWIYFSPEL